MDFQKSITEIIKSRYSCRTFDSKNIENETLNKLNDYIEKINEEAKSAKINSRFLYVSSKENSNKSISKLGTYGVISGAESFIIGIADKDNHDALKFGYLYEKLILFATDLGLNTCWLGGTFNKNDFQQNSSLLENEFIPIVSPVGYKKSKPRIFETAMRAVVGANNRKPWNELFFDENISKPLNESADKYAVPLQMVRLGPSASNKQPWRIIKNRNMYHFFICRTKGYGVMSFDMQMNDIGIAMCHFELSSNQLGLSGNWQKINNINNLEEWEYIISWVS